MKNNGILKNTTVLNALMNLFYQLVTIASGFIIPRLILQTFGSETNGLVSSLNQFLNYIALLEGGISSVIIANLYKPIIDRDNEKISSVVKTAQSFFKKIAYIFLAYSIVLAIIYPIFSHSNFSFEYVFALTLILSINLFVQYNFSLSWKQLLNADKKIYITSGIQILLMILNVSLFVILIKIFPNIHILKLASALIFCLQPILYKIIIDKRYKINKLAKVNNELIKDRWVGFGINLAAFIHVNTDVTILTIFTNLKVVSIYSVYSLITNGLRQLTLSISTGIVPSIGQAYNKESTERLNELFNHYDFIICIITFFLFTIGGLLITPFVMIYTNGIKDINYYQPIFGYLIIISEAIYCLKEPYVNLSYAAKKFKNIKKYAYIEAAINIVISLILVAKFQLIGIAIGTLIAMTYRTIFHVVYLKKNILFRPIRIFFKNIIIFGFVSILMILISIFINPFTDYSIQNWIINALMYSIILIILYIIIAKVFYNKEYVYIKNFILKKK